MTGRVSYLTLTDERYFLGTLGLVNSLRLTGNAGEIIVVDAGLTTSQRALLSDACEVRTFHMEQEGVLPAFLKPAAMEFAISGGIGEALVFIDSDIIVTGSLSPITRMALDGGLCLLPDGPPRLQGRRFEEWRGILGISGQLRRQAYINSGFAAFRPDLWASELARWRGLCEQVAEERSRRPHAMAVDLADSEPFAYLDQDVLNALLMSEIAAERLRILDWWLVGLPEPDDTTRVLDRDRLVCGNAEGVPLLLHHLIHPKPWFEQARGRLRYPPYDELLARLLGGSDVALRPPPRDVPAWLRDGRAHRAARRASRLRSRVRARVLDGR